MNPIVEWLQSDAGEHWSYTFHAGQNDGGRASRHSMGIFASIKYDHESCTWNPHLNDYIACGPPHNHFSHTDNIIKADIDKYGMNGIGERA